MNKDSIPERKKVVGGRYFFLATNLIATIFFMVLIVSVHYGWEASLRDTTNLLKQVNSSWANISKAHLLYHERRDGEREITNSEIIDILDKAMNNLFELVEQHYRLHHGDTRHKKLMDAVGELADESRLFRMLIIQRLKIEPISGKMLREDGDIDKSYKLCLAHIENTRKLSYQYIKAQEAARAKSFNLSMLFGIAIVLVWILTLYFKEKSRQKAAISYIESVGMFRAITEHSRNFTIILDNNKKISYASPSIEKAVGGDKGKLVGNPLGMLFKGAELQKLESEIVPLYESDKQPKPVIEVALKSDSRNIFFEVSVSDMRRVDGVEGIVLNMADVTARKEEEIVQLRLEEKLRQAQKLESLGVLAGGIAHDFNNLLMSILGNTDMALEDLPPYSPAIHSLKRVEDASKQAAELCRQMLAYSGKGRFVIEQVDINLMVDEIATLLKVTIPKGTKLTFDFENKLPPTRGDASQLRQVIMNLITNAAEAIGERGGEVKLITKLIHLDAEFLSETFLDDDIKPGDYISLEVSDNGCGMDKETLASLFDPFFTTKFTGRGLGMAAVLGIVRGHKGVIKVYSEIGLGTTFKIYYPALPAEKRAGSVSTEETSMPATTQRAILLLVDDEPAILDLGQRMLERTGYTVLTAGGGKEAVSIFSEKHDDIKCVVLDLTMPDMGGEETFMELLKIERSVKVIMTSGYNEQEVIQKFNGKGPVGFIQKPYKRKDIAGKIEFALLA